MKRLFTTLIILAGLITVLYVKAQAQGPVVFDHVQIDIWPEYDQPTALVIYKITLPASATLPAQVTLSIPNTVGQPSSVAMQNVDGLLYNLNYTTTTVGAWTKISFTAPSVTLQMEYYDPGLVTNTSARSFQYTWPGDYKVNDLVFRVQQPPTATALTIQPTQGMAATGNDGLTYWGNDVGAVDAGTSVTLKINYTKSDSLLTISQIKPLSTDPAGTGQPAAGGLLQGLSMWMVVGIAGLVLIGGGVTWFVIQRRSLNTIAPERQRHSTTPSPDLPRTNAGLEAATSNVAIYCHQCGKRAVSGDVFCRGCGSRLHS
jgi:hypothetical protein